MNTLKTMLEKEQKSLREEVRRQSVGYIVVAFGFIAGLAWNEAIKAFIEVFFPIRENTLIAKFAYAAVLTVSLAVATAYLMRLTGSHKGEGR